jgi:hypothetical protein
MCIRVPNRTREQIIYAASGNTMLYARRMLELSRTPIGTDFILYISYIQALLLVSRGLVELRVIQLVVES